MVILSTVFRTTSSHFLPEGIQILSIGRGSNQASAIDNAVEQWLMGVLPAFTSYLGNRQKNTLDATMVVGVEETGEKYGWTVHQGPVIYRSYGRETSELKQAEDSEIFQAIFQVVHPYAAHSNLFWLECFATRYADRKLDATCRFNNVDWEEGRTALLNMASHWPTVEDTIISKRQFLLFEPTPVGDLADLAEKVDEQFGEATTEALPWWKRIFARK